MKRRRGQRSILDIYFESGKESNTNFKSKIEIKKVKKNRKIFCIEFMKCRRVLNKCLKMELVANAVDSV